MSFTDYAGTGFAPWLLPIIPIKAPLSDGSKIHDEKLGKIPGRFWPSRKWTGFADWNALAEVPDGALPKWDSWYYPDDPIIGIRSHRFPGIDLDVKKEWQATVARDLAFDIFGETCVRGRSGNSPRQLLMYRLDDEHSLPIVKNKLKFANPEMGEDGAEFAIEILGKGQQYLIEGAHPQGGTYVWNNGATPLEYGFENIPRIRFEQVIEFVQKLKVAYGECMIPLHPVRPEGLRGADTGQGPDASAIGPDHPEVAPSTAELTRALSFLSVLDPEFEEYDAWERISRAIKTACGGSENFYELVYRPWQEANPDNADHIRAKWESHVDSRIGWGYISRLAEAGGGFIPSGEGLFEPLGPDDTVTSSDPGERAAGFRAPVPKLMPEDFVLHKIARRPFVLGHRFMAGAVTLGVAAPGAGKSNLAILTALSIATGQPLTGEEVYEAGPVWIHNNEDSLDELQRRIGGMLKCLGIELDEFRQNILMSSGLDGRLIVAFKAKDIVKRTKAVADVIATIEEMGIVHMVIDPFVSIHLGVSENSNEEIEQVIGAIQDIAHGTGCSIDLVHHALKSHSHDTEVNAGDMNAARGASSLIGAARMVYTLAPMSKKTAENMKLSEVQAARLVRLDHGKGNYAARDTVVRWFELEPFDIGNGDIFRSEGNPIAGDTIAVPKPWKPSAIEPVASKLVKREAKLQRIRDIVAEKMPSNRCLASEVFEAVGDEFNLKESAVRALMKDAIPEGEDVPAEAKGHIYQLTIVKDVPSPPGRLYLVRKEGTILAEAA
jgi:hypothetical protein